MRKKTKIIIGIVFVAAVAALLAWYLHRTSVPVLEPRGIVAQKERNLLVFGLALSAIVVLPVFGLLFTFAWKYRASNTKAKYSPEFSGSRVAETIWWLIPSAIILVLSIVTWNSSHALDPYRPLASTKKTIDIQVVALDWKWLFIYPQQHVASVDFVQFPVGTPVDFSITSDTVMNSFWIPNLGGQIYAMPGMSTQLHLMASKAGSYDGSSANISGAGFSDMTFTAKASSQSDFDAWMKTVRNSPNLLTTAAYEKLAQPTTNNPVTYYSSIESNLYNAIVTKYMTPAAPNGSNEVNIVGAQS